MQTTGNFGLKKPEGMDIVDIQDFNDNADILDAAVAGKVDKVAGKQLSTEDYTTAEKTKLAGIAEGANAYTHPSTHPASIITESTTKRFVSDTEKSAWNAKAETTEASTSAAGLMSAADKTKLNGIAANANNYTHPSTHPPSIIVQDSSNRFVSDTEKSTWNGKAGTAVATTSASGLMSSADKTKVDGIAAGANNYVHPSTHSPAIIAQDANNRFVTDAEKTVWNAKETPAEAQAKADAVQANLNSHLVDNAAHNATAAATASRIMMRDASGRAQVAVPSAAADIARKDTVDAVQSNLTNHLADYVRQPGYGTTGGSGNAYTLTLTPALTAYTAGVGVVVKIHAANTGFSSLNINGLGAKAIKDSQGNDMTSGKLRLNGVYTLRYDGTNFILQGEGGEYGTAGAAQVLTGYTVGTDLGLVSGTMPNRAGDTAALASSVSGTTLKLRASNGYRDGVDDNVTMTDADFVEGNIKLGVDIFGKVGTYDPESVITAGENVITQSLTLSGSQYGDSTTYVKAKEAKVFRSGTVRVKFDLEKHFTSGGTAYGRIYKNGVAVGIERSSTSIDPVTFTEDISVSANELIQLYIRSSSTDNEAFVSNFKLCAAQNPQSIITINSDYPEW